MMSANPYKHRWIVLAPVSVAASFAALFILFLLTLAFWPLAVFLTVALVVTFVVLLVRAPSRGYKLTVGAALIVTLGGAALFLPSWKGMLRHHYFLQERTNHLCAEVPAPARSGVVDCGGSLERISQGNTCDFVVTIELDTSHSQEFLRRYYLSALDTSTHLVNTTSRDDTVLVEWWIPRPDGGDIRCQ